jgi:mRNA interferase HigB
MRIIKESFLKEMADGYPRAARALAEWIAAFKAAEFANPVQMKAVFHTVDPVIVKSGNTVYVFNIRRNEFRLIAAIHFNRQVVFTLRFFTHAEYDRQKWKEEL